MRVYVSTATEIYVPVDVDVQREEGLSAGTHAQIPRAIVESESHLHSHTLFRMVLWHLWF